MLVRLLILVMLVIGLGPVVLLLVLVLTLWMLLRLGITNAETPTTMELDESNAASNSVTCLVLRLLVPVCVELLRLEVIMVIRTPSTAAIRRLDTPDAVDAVPVVDVMNTWDPNRHKQAKELLREKCRLQLQQTDQLVDYCVCFSSLDRVNGSTSTATTPLLLLLLFDDACGVLF